MSVPTFDSAKADLRSSYRGLRRLPKDTLLAGVSGLIRRTAFVLSCAVDEGCAARRIRGHYSYHRRWSAEGKALLRVALLSMGRAAWPQIRRCLRAEVGMLRAQHPNGLVAHRRVPSPEIA